MRARLTVLILAAMLATVARGGGASDLEALMARWIALRTALAGERAAWEEQEISLRAEISLLETEHAKLKTDLASFAASASTQDERAAAEAQRSEQLRRALDGVGPVLSRTEADVRSLRRFVPEPLQGETARLFDALEAPETAMRRATLGERAQRVVALLAHIESLQGQVHVAQEMLDDGVGGRRLSDVLYLGLARAFAVSMDDAWAAVGRPGDAGWAWMPRPEIAARVRKAIRIANRDRMAAFVDLPLQVAPGDAP